MWLDSVEQEIERTNHTTPAMQRRMARALREQSAYIKHLEELFGWKPSTSPEEGVKMLLGWIKENKRLF